jgi:hypothetical protein
MEEGKNTRFRIFTPCGNSSTLIVSFRGTSNKNNWDENKRIRLVPFKYATDFSPKRDLNVHEGMQNSYTELQQKLRKFLNEKTFNQFQKVVFTGHSLGGALAMLAAAEYAGVVRYASKISVLAYGSPRVGNKMFAHYLNVRIHSIYRQVEKNDLIPHIPGTDIGFVHVGREFYFAYSKMHFCFSSEDPHCSRSHKTVQLVPHQWYRGKRYWGQSYCNHGTFASNVKRHGRNFFEYIASQFKQNKVEEFCEAMLGQGKGRLCTSS